MNSDNFDKLFKEQILSLDQVPVRGSSWNPEPGWEKVSAGLKKPKRRMIIWLSAAASIVILFGVSLSLFFQTQNTQTTKTSIQNAKQITNPAKAIYVNKTNNPKSEQSLIVDNPNTSKTPIPVALPEKQNPEKLTGLIRMAPLMLTQISPPDNMDLIQIRKETTVVTKNKAQSRTLNRTYVFNKPTKNKLNEPEKTKNFTFSIGTKSKLTSNPPKGLLAGL